MDRTNAPRLGSINYQLRAVYQAGSGGGSCTHRGRAYEARPNLILPAVKKWSRRVTPPHNLACRASALLVCHDPNKIRNPKSAIQNPNDENRSNLQAPKPRSSARE